MDAVHANDATAFEALLDGFAVPVYSVALTVTGSYQLAAEATEDVFRQIRTRPGGLEDPSSTPRTDMIRLAHQHAVRRVRAERAQGPAGHPAAGQAHAPRPPASPLLEQLTADEAAALKVTYFQGHTLQEAASILGHPVPALVEQLRSALAKLRATAHR